MIDALSLLLEPFQWLRPWWLLALLPMPIVLWLLNRRPAGAGRWQDAIDSHLLPVLLQQGKVGQSSRWPLLLIALAWTLASIALAGPSFRSQDSQLFQREQARVYVLDLSPSMNADDVKPSRLARARLKLLDALNQRRDGEQALMVYAGSAHVLTPLATDARTLAAQVPVLSTSLPPVRGNRPELALARAVQLLRDAGHQGGEIVWLTDGIDTDQIERILAVLRDEPIRLAVLAIGSSDGAPVRQESGALLTDAAGKVVLARLDLAPLQTVVNAVNGRLTTLAADDSDWLALQFPPSAFADSRQLDGSISQPEDAGAWLVLPLLVLVLVAFRRGSLLPVCLLALSGFSPPSEAGWWQDLWRTPNQQAAQQLQAGDAKAAAAQFTDPAWRATAQYRDGNYPQAASDFTGTDAVSQFNRGNALAKAGQLDEAIAAYDRALKQKADFTAAKENRAAVEQRRQQQNKAGQQHNQKQEQQGAAGDEQASAQQQSAAEKPDPNAQQPTSSGQQNAAPSQANSGEDSPPPVPGDRRDAEQKKSEPKKPTPDQQKNAAARPESSQQLDAAEPNADAARAGEDQELPANERPLPTALKQLPDDPGGLLRRKMKLEYLRRGQDSQVQDQEQRW